MTEAADVRFVYLGAGSAVLVASLGVLHGLSSAFRPSKKLERRCVMVNVWSPSRRLFTALVFANMTLAVLLLLFVSSQTVPASAETNVRYISVAAGDDHTLALSEDGTVWAWGSNYYGQIGNGAKKDAVKTPQKLETISGVKALSAGSEATLALKTDGTVWAWGNNDYGRLGDGTNEERLTPVRVKGLENVVAVSLGATHAAALDVDGAVWTWGRNLYGQLSGDADPRGRMTPAKVEGLPRIIAVSAGGRHTLALDSDGRVWAWGDNEYGQLGIGKRDSSNTPIQVAGVEGIVAVAAGALHSVAVKDDGSVWVWGYNEYGVLGTGDTTNSNVPVQLKSISDVVAVAAGTYHTLFLKRDGTVWACGYNKSGQLGTNKRETVKSPVQVTGLAEIVAISAGKTHSAAVRKDGSIWVWGTNSDYQLGLTSRNDDETRNPARVLPIASPDTAKQEPSSAVAAAGSDASRLDVAPANAAPANAGATQASAPAPNPAADSTTIVINPNSTRFTVDGTDLAWESGRDTTHSFVNGRLMVPPQALVEALGGECTYDSQSGKITLELGKTLEMQLGQDTLTVDGQPRNIDVAPQIVNGTLLIPLVHVIDAVGGVTRIDNATGNVTVELKRPKLILVKPDAKGTVQGTQFVYEGKVLFDEVGTTLEWAAMSPDQRFVAYKAEDKIKLYDLEKKAAYLIYKMSSEEYLGKWVYNYGFLPGYRYDFVGWSADSRYFVVNKDYPGLFKGGTGYYKITAATGYMSPVPKDDVVFQ